MSLPDNSSDRKVPLHGTSAATIMPMIPFSKPEQSKVWWSYFFRVKIAVTRIRIAHVNSVRVFGSKLRKGLGKGYRTVQKGLRHALRRHPQTALQPPSSHPLRVPDTLDKAVIPRPAPSDARLATPLHPSRNLLALSLAKWWFRSWGRKRWISTESLRMSFYFPKSMHRLHTRTLQSCAIQKSSFECICLLT